MGRADEIINKALILSNENPANQREYLAISNNDFRDLFMRFANEHVSNGFKEDVEFHVNDNNRKVINQLYYYLIGSVKFNGDRTKGILLIGPYGNGKTTILKVISDIIFHVIKKRFYFISSPGLVDALEIHGMAYFYRRPLLIDEIGREPKVIKDYGTERHPMQELLSERYNQKSWTFATSNFNLQAMKEFYGGYIEDRLVEMFNIIELKGKSFRV